MVSSISGELKTGDLVLVLDNRIRIGFYLGHGSGSSLTYYSTYGLIRYMERWNNGERHHKCYKNNIFGHTKDRIMKYSPDLLFGEALDEYNKALEAFKFLNRERDEQ